MIADCPQSDQRVHCLTEFGKMFKFRSVGNLKFVPSLTVAHGAVYHVFSSRAEAIAGPRQKQTPHTGGALPGIVRAEREKFRVTADLSPIRVFFLWSDHEVRNLDHQISTVDSVLH